MLYKLSKSVVWLLLHLVYRFDVSGRENIPGSGALICPNHYHLLDPVVVAICLPIHQIHYMAKHEVFRNPLAGWFLRGVGVFPIKRGEPDLNSIKTTLKLLKEEELVGLFPEGTRSKTGDLGVANPGVALFAIKSGKPVVPVAITGSYRLFSTVTIRYGQPFDLVPYKKEKMTNDDYFKISQLVMDKVRQLKEEKA